MSSKEKKTIKLTGWQQQQQQQQFLRGGSPRFWDPILTRNVGPRTQIEKS